MPSVNEELMNSAISHEVDLRRYSNSVVARIIAVLNRSDSAIASELAVKLEGMTATNFSMERLEGMLYSIRSLNHDAYNKIERDLTAELKDFTQYEVTFQQSTLTSVLPVQISVVGVAADQVYAAALSRPFQGNLLKGFLADMEAKKAKIIRQTIADGYVQGKTTGDIVRSIRGTRAKGYSDGVIEITRRDAQAVVRTALSHTAARAKQGMFDANADLIKGYCWLATLDLRTSSPCRARDHKQYDMNFKPVGHSLPWGAGPGAFHWNCFPAGTLVTASSKITGAYKRWFEGDLVIIRTSANRFVSCTPNHPILTGRGWVAAELINKLDKVACDGGRQWVGTGNNDGDDVPSLIENVAESFLVSSGVFAMEVPVSAPDFHGDGVGSNVAVVGSNRSLFAACEAVIPEHLDEFRLIDGSALASVSMTSKSALRSLFDASRSSGRGLMCFFSESFYLLWGGIRHAGKLLLASIADGFSHSGQMPSNNAMGCVESACNSFDSDPGVVKTHDFAIAKHNQLERCVPPILSENPGNNLLRNPEGSSDRVDAFSCIEAAEYQSGVKIMYAPTDVDAPVFKQGCHSDVAESDLTANLLSGKSGSVFLDDVISIERTWFSGHVFNLETELGFYTANGIISHNCRSTRTPILKSLKELTGLDMADFTPTERASMDGVVPASTDYGQWIKAQSAARQDDVLGKSRGQLLRSGGLSLNDMYSAKGSPLTLAQLRDRHAGAFAKAGL